MLRKGTRVERLTKKVGQTAPIGKIVEFRDQNRIEVLWDDGHTSVVSRDGLTKVTEANDPHKDN